MMGKCQYCGHKSFDIEGLICVNPVCKNYETMVPPYKLEPTSITPSGVHWSDVNATGPSNFVKHDLGKPLMSLIEPDFIIKLGELLTFGANKYEKDNWKKCEDPTRYKDALLRHLYAYLSGELIDPESGMEHLTAVAFNVMALQYFDKEKSL